MHNNQYLEKPIRTWIAILILLAVVCTGCSQSRQDGTCTAEFNSGKTFSNVCLMKISNRIETTQFQFSASITEGSLDWTLTDPNGNVYWQSTLQAGESIKETKQIDQPLSGTWVLNLDIREAKGKYIGEWSAQ